VTSTRTTAVTIALVVAPWTPRRQYADFEVALALAREDYEEKLVAQKISLTRSIATMIARFGIQEFPELLLSWKGKLLHFFKRNRKS